MNSTKVGDCGRVERIIDLIVEFVVHMACLKKIFSSEANTAPFCSIAQTVAHLLILRLTFYILLHYLLFCLVDLILRLRRPNSVTFSLFESKLAFEVELGFEVAKNLRSKWNLRSKRNLRSRHLG